jgi:PKD repeat protein
LTATNADGSNTTIKAGYITATTPVTPLIAGFNATPLTGTAPLSVTFTDMTVGLPTSWYWDFGDGNHSTLQNPTNVYTTVGSYSVRLNVSNPNTQNSTVKTNYINVVSSGPGVVVRLIDSAGNGLSGVNIQYYSGSWKDFGTTDANGEARKDLTAGTYSFRVTYAFASNDKQQNIATNSTVIFQTLHTTVELRDSGGNLITEPNVGTVQYYAGSWRDFGTTTNGQVTRELLPNTQSFRMTYAYASNDKQQNTGINPVVTFQTKNTVVELRDSSGNLITNPGAGTVQYYAGAWRNFGNTAGGQVSKELLPNNQSFRMTYAYASNDKQQDTGINPTVTFQTKNTIIELRDSSGNLITAPNAGNVKYYAGAWRDFGDTSGGQVSKELLPNNQSFRMTYSYASNDKLQDTGINPTVTFQTKSTIVELRDSSGNLITDPNAGNVKYYAGAWRDFGETTGGQAVKELLPNSQSFRMTYAYASNDKQQDTGSDPTIKFYTGNVISNSGSCTFYYAGAWRPFTNGMELLPVQYTFRFSDGTPDTPFTILERTINSIH